MKRKSPYLNREEQAMKEVGRTEISRSCVFVITTVFLAVIYSVPLVQTANDFLAFRSGKRASPVPQCLDIFKRIGPAISVFAETQGSLLDRLFAANRGLLRDIHVYEETLEDESVVGRMIRPEIQYMLSRWLGAGNEKAYCGVRPWLFYRSDVDYLTAPGFLEPSQLAGRLATGSEWRSAPQPDPRPAIVDFHRQLERRGIRLVVMPLPPKTVVHPEKFARRFKPGPEPSQNPSYNLFINDLENSGVTVVDPTPLLMEMRSSLGEVYLATDTHWRSEAVEGVARLLARFIADNIRLPPCPNPGYLRHEAVVTNRGDIAVMLRLPDGTRAFSPEVARLRQILGADYGFWRNEQASDVLVLGDSFCNIYSLNAMGWGESAGFVEQLSFELDRPLDRLVINDNGAYATRALLARELARGRDRLAGKRLVIWTFAMRELAAGDWQSVPLVTGKPPPAKFVAPDSGRHMIVRGRVRDVAPVPRPGTVPYKDHILALHLVDVADENGTVRDGQALVYMMSMRDNEWTLAAHMRSGESAKLRLCPWRDVERQYEGINRTELADDELQLVEPCWGELILP